jgi:hypothetical protein
VTLKLFSEPSKVIRVTEIVSDICACARIRSRPGNLLLVLALPALTHISSLFLKKKIIYRSRLFAVIFDEKLRPKGVNIILNTG